MNPGQQVRHYSLVCRRMCLDGAGLAGRLSSAREKGVGTAAVKRLQPCPLTPFGQEDYNQKNIEIETDFDILSFGSICRDMWATVAATAHWCLMEPTSRPYFFPFPLDKRKKEMS